MAVTRSKALSDIGSSSSSRGIVSSSQLESSSAGVCGGIDVGCDGRGGFRVSSLMSRGPTGRHPSAARNYSLEHALGARELIHLLFELRGVFAGNGGARLVDGASGLGDGVAPEIGAADDALDLGEH